MLAVFSSGTSTSSSFPPHFSFSAIPCELVLIATFLRSCQTCPGAWCEDCFESISGGVGGDAGSGQGEIEAVGDVLPELALLGFGAKSQAFWIRCAECLGTLSFPPFPFPSS
jgi:hypothetical protein